MQRSWSLSAKLGAIGGALLLVAFASISLTLWVTWQLEGGAAAVNEAGRMRMQAWRLVHALQRADAPQVNDLITQFDRSVEILRTGDPARPLFVPSDQGTRQAFADVRGAWADLRGNWTSPALPAAADAADYALHTGLCRTGAISGPNANRPGTRLYDLHRRHGWKYDYEKRCSEYKCACGIRPRCADRLLFDLLQRAASDDRDPRRLLCAGYRCDEHRRNACVQRIL